MPTLTEVIERTGIAERTVRSWVDQGLLPKPHRNGREAVFDDAIWHFMAIAQVLAPMPLTQRRKVITDRVIEYKVGRLRVRLEYKDDGTIQITYNRYQP